MKNMFKTISWSAGKKELIGYVTTSIASGICSHWKKKHGLITVSRSAILIAHGYI
jgi:hypothetical protein